MTFQRSTYMGSGDPARRDANYYPWWLDNLADDATGEGAFMQGAAHGAAAVRSLVTYARTLYEYQDFNNFGDYGDDRFIEDYTTQIRGEPTGVIVTVTRNAAGDAQHIVVNHRPRDSMLLLARLCAGEFAGTSLESLFGDGKPDSRTSVGATYLDNINGVTEYYPEWLDNLADDATLEGAAMNGTARGAETVRSIVLYARTLYEHQVFRYTGPYGGNGFLEQYTTPIKGQATGVVVSVTRNVAGEAQHISVNHRPRSSVLLFSRLMGEKFADTAIGEHFILPTDPVVG
ncbi:MAG: hypothetical protein JO046_08950 [Solirubrobacterales bacterium]|nr:hypothetical protein [Solirubrobacterales bacterium]MBV9366560.1 hypothetical protein [Solirubrobacterales bacterium]MBV9681906.1 hypothetical protein [Solirubrobacterales bacterium]